jgi:salicylaldehyde dehydrogenase
MESQLLIDNQWRAAVSGGTFERRHPTTNELVTRAAAGVPGLASLDSD